MLTRLRARAVDGATNLVRLLDARRERDELRAELREVARERNDGRMELRRLRAKAERYYSMADGLHAEWDAALAERDELQAEVERLTAENDGLRAAGDRLVAETVSFATERGELLRLRAEADRMREALDLNQRSREESNAGNETLRRELFKALTGDGVPLDGDDIVARVLAVIAERDARIPTDIDGAQAWAAKRGVLVEGGRRDTDWHCVVMSGEVVQRTNNRADAVHIAVWHSLHGMWRDDA